MLVLLLAVFSDLKKINPLAGIVAEDVFSEVSGLHYCLSILLENCWFYRLAYADSLMCGCWSVQGMYMEVV